jgi:hypothetical protein
MTTIPLVYAARHMFVDLPEGRWLVDTGSPLSFGDTGSITWAGHRRSIARRLGPIGMEQIRPHVDCPVVGLIGLDILNESESCWDGPAGQFHIGPRPVAADAVVMPFESVMGVPVIRVSVGGNALRCIFDTGAQYGYLLTESIARTGVPDGAISDFNPILGAISSGAWKLEVQAQGLRFVERFGVLGGAGAMSLSMMSIDGIVGCSWLPGCTVWYRPGDGSIAIRPSDCALSPGARDR